MSKYDLYRDLCKEAGTYDSGFAGNSEQWWVECSHNINRELDYWLELAATGNVPAIVEVRRMMGLPIIR